MSLDITQPATALTDSIQARFLEGHRRASSELLAMARRSVVFEGELFAGCAGKNRRGVVNERVIR